MKRLDLVGQRFGYLTVIKRIGSNKSHATWLCRCDCGNEKIANTGKLRSGDIKSCGCMHYKACITHGMTNTRLYHIWCTMKARCNRPSSQKYSRYGGRGIKLCDEWQSFEPFRDWALSNGYAENLSIDRIDNNGNYEPNNCRWATNKQQSRNMSSNRLIEYNGEKHTIPEWAEMLGFPKSCIYHRIERGWDIGKALLTPISEAR